MTAAPAPPSTDAARYRSRSMWLDTCGDALEPRPALSGDIDVDVAIVGAGYTGLWAAYYLKTQQPDLRVAVLEAETAGFGASGRNGGWAMGVLPGSADRYAKSTSRDAVLRAQRACFDLVDEIGRVCSAEGIDCDYVKGGELQVAPTSAQLPRVRAEIEHARHWGYGEDDMRWLEADELAARVKIPGALGAGYTPHCARIHPAKLARGLAEVVERLGVTIYERTPVQTIETRKAVTPFGTVSAEAVLRATEAFTTLLPGQSRRFLALYSLMVATEPLPDSIWEEIGWHGRETMTDMKHLFCYAQRTEDGRIAIGGRGAPYRLGSGISEANETNEGVRERLRKTVAAYWPAAADAEITHHWGGAIAVPRDWCASLHFDRATGLGAAGGYTGHGVGIANLMGRTLADLVLGLETERVHYPWVGHSCRSWEPEPLRFIAATTIVNTLRTADLAEAKSGKPARRVRLLKPVLPPS